jgi:hypothetical protein
MEVIGDGYFYWYILPTIDSFTPAQGPSGGGVNVTLTGIGFFYSSAMICK